MSTNKTMPRPTAQVVIGSHVTIMLGEGEILKIIIKTPKEIDPDNYVISNESPLGRSLLGKKEGERFSYQVGEKAFSGAVLEVGLTG